MFDISNLLKEMKKKRISRRNIAKRIGITYKTFHMKEKRSISGDNSFYIEELLKMAEILEVENLNDILFDNKLMNKKEIEYIHYAIGMVDLGLKEKLNNGIDKYNYEQTRPAVLWNLEVKDYLISLLPENEKNKIPKMMFIKDEQDVKRRLGLK